MRPTEEFSTSFASHLAGTTQSAVELFSISAPGMTSQYYTDCNTSINMPTIGITYTPYAIRRSKISFSTDLKPNGVEINMALNSDLSTARLKGVLAGASVSITRVNVDDPDNQNLLLFDGEVGAVDIDEDVLTVKATTLDFLSQELPRREYQVACNWRLFDDYCTLGLTNYQLTGTFSSASTDRKTLVSTTFAGQSNDYFLQGFVTITSSLNDQVKRNVTSHAGNTVTVVPPFPFDVAATDTFNIAPGCKHDVTDCENKFDNIINYGGFPWIPTQDVVL